MRIPKKHPGPLTVTGTDLLWVEELNHALERGAHIYCELSGYGVSSDAYRIAAPEPAAAQQARTMTNAMKRAGTYPEDIDYINAYGTSTLLNDATETPAIRKALGKTADTVLSAG